MAGAPLDLPDRDQLLELATALQTTLAIEQLLGLFAEHCTRSVSHDSLDYLSPDGTTLGPFGSPAANACTYKLVLAEQDLGTVRFTRCRPFSERDTAALENLLCNLVHPLRNALLYQSALRAATKDPLTGVYNRASLPSTLEREVGLAKRHAHHLSIILLDADHFKQVNDTYGHLAGDHVLRSLGHTIGTCLRDSDILFRYGGEEFLVLLSNTPETGALCLAERIRRAIADRAILFQDNAFTLTVSLGIASLAAHDTHHTLIGKADLALYYAKTQGRNRAVTHGATQHHALGMV
jgi:diguanylate cyclase (GGDEF)-like protein